MKDVERFEAWTRRKNKDIFVTTSLQLLYQKITFTKEVNILKKDSISLESWSRVERLFCNISRIKNTMQTDPQN